MSSLLDPTASFSSTSNRDASKDQPVAVLDEMAGPEQPSAPVSFSLDERLRSIAPRTPVTWTLVVANGILFAAMAISHGRLTHFNAHVLLSWGGGFAPRVFGAQWLRAGSYLFVHGDLAHLASNLLFLLLIAPLLERLLGSLRFALVYLFAGVGGGLLLMGTSPQHIVVGASAAVYGIYGALLGCCLSGPRSIPWRMVAQRGGLLLLFTAVILLSEWCDFERQPIGHLGGFVFGFVGGLFCGHRLQPSAARWQRLRLAVAAILCVALISLTAWGVHRCAAKALTYYAKYAPAKDRERELLGQFDSALRQWEEGKLTSAKWKELLAKKLIPAWQDARSNFGLKFTGKLAELERQRYSMRDFWSEMRALRGEPKTHDDKPLTIEEYGKMVSLLNKLRLDTWHDLASELSGDHIMMVRALLDHHELEMLYASLDEEVNEDNPLHRWFGLARGPKRRVEKEAEEPDQGLIKNRGFENRLQGWIPFSFGHPAGLELDTKVMHEGRQAFRVSAAWPSDAGCYQDIPLKPRHWYRFSGWVRTNQLDPRGSPNYGTYLITRGGGNQIIKAGRNYKGMNDWTKVPIVFQAPPGGLTRIYVVFVNFGRGTGTAWFDDLKLVEVHQPAR